MDKFIDLIAAKTDKSNTGLWLPLIMHLEDTTGILKKIMDDWVTEGIVKASGLSFENLKLMAVFSAGVHDIGKSTCYFQEMITRGLPSIREVQKEYISYPRDLQPGKTPHAKSGAAILDYLEAPDEVSGICQIVGAHHGKTLAQNDFLSDLPEEYEQNFFGEEEDRELWEGTWDYFLKDALRNAGLDSMEELPSVKLPGQILITGLLIMADWIASNTNFFPLIPVTQVTDYSEYYPDRVEKAWNDLHLEKPWESESCPFNDEEFNTIFGFSPNDIQKAMIKMASNVDNPGLIICEAPMGIGKTEAALAAATILNAKEKEGGLFFGLPTQATANGIFTRIEKWGETQSTQFRHSIRLAHSMAAYNNEYRKLLTKNTTSIDIDEGNGIVVNDWFNGKKQALLADFVISTVDQMLMAGLQQKHFMLRHLALSGKVVIVDEVHSYDVYTDQYLKAVLSWLGVYRVPVILLSATLPAQKRVELTEAYTGIVDSDDISWKLNRGYPLLTWTNGQKVEQETIPSIAEKKCVQIHWMQKTELVLRISSLLADGGCAGVIVNTVREAQTTAKSLRNALPQEYKIIVYHAKYVISDRMRKEETISRSVGKKSSLRERNKVIVVGTQVLEQSLDIDFDVLFTQLCPMDLFLQRVGRLHRHSRNRTEKLSMPSVYFITEEDGGWDKASEKIYSRWLMLRTYRKLRNIDKLTLPEDIPSMVQDIYDDGLLIGENNDDYKFSKKEFFQNKLSKISRAKAFLMRAPSNADLDYFSIAGMNNNDVGNTDSGARMCVRDIKNSVDVLLVWMDDDQSIHYFPWQKVESDDSLSPLHAPSQDQCIDLMQQKVGLPYAMTMDFNIDSTIRALEEINQTKLSSWQESPLLKGELFFVLDKNWKASVNGYIIKYSEEYGLEATGEKANV